MRHWPTAVASVSLALAAAGCSGGSEDAEAPNSNRQAPTASSRASTAPPTSVTTTRPTTTTTTTIATTTTTPPPVVELIIEHVADLPGRAIRSPFTDGTSIIGLSSVDTGRPFTADGLVRLDTAGTIIQEAPLDSVFLSGIGEVDGRRFVLGSFPEPDNPYLCGLRELDATTLALGATIALPTDSGCGGPLISDDVNPAILVTADSRDPIVFRVDTSTGTVVPISLDPVVTFGYDVRELFTLGGVTYAWCVAGFNPVTGEEATAPDGSPLQPLIARIDAATGEVTAAPVSGPFVVVSDQLVVRLDESRAQIIDPVTLAPTEVAASEVRLPDEELAVAGDVAWSFVVDTAGILTVSLRDPATQQVLTEASADSGFGGNQFGNYRGVTIGSEFYVVAARQTFGDGSTSSLTKIFRAVLRPV